MIATRLLEELRSRDIEIRADGDQLRCSAPAGALVPELLADLQAHKGELLHFLRTTERLARQQPGIVPLQPAGTHAPVFAVPGHNGDVFCYRQLARHLGNEQPFYGLQPPGVDGKEAPLTSVHALATCFAAQIRTFQPDGGCIIAGYCAGGTIAFELARQLLQQGTSVRFVALFGSPRPGWYRFLPQFRLLAAQQAARVGKHVRALLSLPAEELHHYLARKMVDRAKRQRDHEHARDDPVLRRRAHLENTTLAAVRSYEPAPIDCRLAVFLPGPTWLKPGNALLRWHAALATGADEYCGPEDCSGENMLLEPHAAIMAELFRQHRDRILES